MIPGGSESREFACIAGDLDLIPGLRDSLGKGMAFHSISLAWRIPWTGVWWATDHGVSKSRTQLSD